MRRFAWLMSLVILAASAALAGSIQWEADYTKALDKCRQEKKPLLLFFSGSDWSGWSMKMKKEVLDEPLFVEKMKEAFIFVEVDFPSNRTLPDPFASQNEMLKKRFRIQEYPRLLVIDQSEKEIARLGVESSTNLASVLSTLLENKRRLDGAINEMEVKKFSSSELTSLYKLATELKDENALSFLLEKGMQSEEPLFFLCEKYRSFADSGNATTKEAIALREKLFSLDPLNQKKVHLTVALIDFQTRDSALGLNRKEVIRPLEEYLARFGESDCENRWRIEMMVAQFYLNYDENQEALRHAEVASKMAPPDKREEMERTVDYIRKLPQLASRK